MKDKDFLLWLVDRLVEVYKESPNTDFVLKLKSIAIKTGSNKETANEVHNNS